MTLYMSYIMLTEKTEEKKNPPLKKKKKERKNKYPITPKRSYK